jgi:lipopolysaccharide/colanic/teichoic acid biosynthesis glycosyltransferase
MLRLMMDSHPELAIPGESHFIPRLWKLRNRYLSRGRLDAYRLAADITRTPFFQQWGIPQEPVWRRVGRLTSPGFTDVLEAFFLAYADERGKARWGDKTPIYVLHIPLLAALFPRARFVHIIRDGRDVALSYFEFPLGPSNVWEAACRWRRDVSAGQGAGTALQGRYMEVRYEQLVRDPEDLLRGICDFVQLDFDSRMLEYHRGAQDRIQSRDDLTVFHKSVARPPIVGIRNWREELPPKQIRDFEAVAGALLTDLGYERLFPQVYLAGRLKAELKVSHIRSRAFGSRMKKCILRRSSDPVGISTAPMRGSRGRRFNRAAALVVKRGLDMSISFLLLMLALPLLALVALAIKLDSRGPVFFRQEREGRNGKRFRIFKFRSMAKDAERGGPVLSMDDPRISRVGRVLRRTSLDELPQLLNVLLGQMSLVGPRPLLPGTTLPQEKRRLDMRPGMTGLVEISNPHLLGWDERMRVDVRYVERWSLWLDMHILLTTIPVLFTRKDILDLPRA